MQLEVYSHLCDQCLVACSTYSWGRGSGTASAACLQSSSIALPICNKRRPQRRWAASCQEMYVPLSSSSSAIAFSISFPLSLGFLTAM